MMRFFSKMMKICRSFRFSYLTYNKNKAKICGKIIIENRNIKIGKNIILYGNVKFWGNGPITIGDNCKIGDNTMIYASKNGGVHIGNDSLIAANCYIIDMNHGLSKENIIMKNPCEVQPVFVGDDCWIGEGCTLLKGTKLGKGTVVGAKSLVNHEFGDYKIIAGIPAKVLKERT